MIVSKAFLVETLQQDSQDRRTAFRNSTSAHCGLCHHEMHIPRNAQTVVILHSLKPGVSVAVFEETRIT